MFLMIKKLLFFLLLFFFFPKSVFSETMRSESYEIRWGNMNIGTGVGVTSPSFKLDSTMGQIAPGEYAKAGYLVRSGFQYIHTIIPFTFTISDLSIAFGSLVVGTPSTATNDLTVSAGGASGWQVLAFEDHPLRSMAGDEIDDTSCDSGCTRTSAGAWTQNSAYGFGFNMSGDNISSDFTSGDHYRPFSDFETYAEAVEIMTSTEATASATATVTYKVNIGGQQEAGDYQNSITFIAVPGY
jgi:hypothetical protein